MSVSLEEGENGEESLRRMKIRCRLGLWLNDLSKKRNAEPLVDILGVLKHYAGGYVVVGALGTIGYVCVLKMFVDGLKQEPVMSSGISFILIVIATYLGNYFWTFQSSSHHFVVLPGFAGIALIGFVLNVAIMYLSVDVLGLWYLVGALMTVLVVTLSNFVLHVYWSFRILDVVKKDLEKRETSGASIGS